MLKKILILSLAIAMIAPTMAMGNPAQAADDSRVCGMDGVTYASADAAEAAGVDVSYEFACVETVSEQGLYEATSDIHFVGMLVEIGSTDVPTTLIIRPNQGGLDETVNVTTETVMGQRRDQYTKLSDWIPGDQIRVIGKKNENTGTVDAVILVNLSIVVRGNLFSGANGWITDIDKDNKIVSYQWNNKEYKFIYNDDTHFVAAGKNPASIDDLEINDRIRGRLLKRFGNQNSAVEALPVAKIVIVLRRGSNLFMKIRTFRPNAQLVRITSTVIPTTIQVKILKTPELRANDVNNLIGDEGRLVTVNINEYTRLVRKYFGRTTLDEFAVGDMLKIVGRVNDDDTVDAKMVKDNSVWKASTRGHAGVVVEVNADENYMMVNWRPYKHITRKRLLEKLKSSESTVEAQMTGQAEAVVSENTSKTGAAKIGRFIRNIIRKRIKIARVKHAGLKIGDLITRRPVKKIRVNVNEDTKIIIGTNTNGALEDIQAGDKIRTRGTWSETEKVFTAETIVVVNSIPEIEAAEDTPLDEVNETAAEIVTDDTTGALTADSATETEEEL